MEHKGELLRAESEIFFRFSRRSLTAPYWSAKTGRTYYVNPEFTHITGYTLEDVPTGRDVVRKAFSESRDGEKFFESWWNDPPSESY